MQNINQFQSISGISEALNIGADMLNVHKINFEGAWFIENETFGGILNIFRVAA
ncbi:hypothetical protein P9850_01975 [Anoxybacillus rupiensis]|uniref:Uncharacterized protein n=1 Tax=Anoxybacteroides rupiense TaxID=311460 RepID=A0ABD5IRY0_9BACL|nr:hypothetical protein [Anoxybacillus rupiensis]